MKPLQGLSWLVEFLFPNGCLICGSSLLGSREPFVPLCDACAVSLKDTYITSRRCGVCGTIITSEDFLCLRCRDRPFSFESHLSPFLYSGAVKTLLLGYKNGGYNALSFFFAAVLADYHHQHFPGIPLVPVPSRPSALRHRGFDTTGLICRHLAGIYGIPVLRLLGRKNARQQKTLGYNDRFLNLEGKLFLKKSPDSSVRRVLLIDDVYTSGATAEACASVLKKAGLDRVDVLTIAQD